MSCLWWSCILLLVAFAPAGDAQTVVLPPGTTTFCEQQLTTHLTAGWGAILEVDAECVMEGSVLLGSRVALEVLGTVNMLTNSSLRFSGVNRTSGIFYADDFSTFDPSWHVEAGTPRPFCRNITILRTPFSNSSSCPQPTCNYPACPGGMSCGCHNRFLNDTTNYYCVVVFCQNRTETPSPTSRTTSTTTDIATATATDTATPVRSATRTPSPSSTPTETSSPTSLPLQNCPTL